MTNNNEMEFSLVDGNLLELQDDYTKRRSRVEELTDSYFDTKGRVLEMNGLVFRQRIINDNERVIYTIKGKTIPDEYGIPMRFEEEDPDFYKMKRLLSKMVPHFKPSITNLHVYHHRITIREVYPIKAFDMFVDSVEYSLSPFKHAYYDNVELELYDINKKQSLIDFKNMLKEKYGFKEWNHSKFAVGKAVRALELTGDIRTEELNRINDYLLGLEKGIKVI